MLGSLQSENFSYPQIFDEQSLQTCGELHLSNLGDEVCGDEDPDCTLCFHRRTG